MTMLLSFLESSLVYQYIEHFCDTCAITRELRIACTVAQMEREGGISPRVSPLAQACVIAKLVYYFFISEDNLYFERMQ